MSNIFGSQHKRKLESLEHPIDATGILQAAKIGQWHVFNKHLANPSIPLTSNDFNELPPGRTYGVLHQIAYHRHLPALTGLLLAHPLVDLKLRTKDGQTALEVAEEQRGGEKTSDFLEQLRERQEVQTHHELVNKARDGKWLELFKQLETEPLPIETINAVPPGRTWGILHQICYWGRLDILNRLLTMFPDLDLEVDTDEEAAVQEPTDIAIGRGHTDFVTALQAKLEQHKPSPKGPSAASPPSPKGTSAASPPTPDMREAMGGEKDVDFFDGFQDVVSTWQQDDAWVCYYDDNSESSSSNDEFVFNPPLILSRCGVYRTEGDDWETLCEPFHIEVVRKLISLTGRRDECADECIGHGDESDHVWVPVAIKWSEGNGELSPESLLQRLGAHPQLMDSNNELEFHLDHDEDDDSSSSSGEKEYDSFEELVKSFLDGYDSKAFFCAGDRKLNPVPVFAVARVSPTLVAGFMGGVVYT